MTDAFGYGLAGKHLLLKDVSWTADTIQAGLFADTYTPNVDTDQYLSDIISNEISGGGYARKTLTTKSVGYSSDNNMAQCLSDALSWTSLTASFRYVVFFQWTGTNGTSVLLSYIDYGTAVSVTSGTWNVPVPDNGYIAIQV
jgi:hypothetical protein